MTTIIDSAAAAKVADGSAEALLRAAVSGAKAPPATVSSDASAKTAPVFPSRTRRLDPLMMGVAGAALALGTLLGAGAAILAAPKADAGVALADLGAGLESGRADVLRLAGEVERLGRTVAALRDTEDSTRGEVTTRGTALVERMGRMEQAVTAKVAVLGERIDQAEREHTARIAALAVPIDRKPVVAAVPPVPAPSPKVEVAQTGSIPDAKPSVIETWAVREVYDGTAMLEDRRRRLVEVAAGDSIPGIGRVDSVERRGRTWVVVTRQGIVTPQPW